MADQSGSNHFDIVTNIRSLTVQDLLQADLSNGVSEYLSLSLNFNDDNIKVCITTTNSKPVTYCTIISSKAGVDLQSLRFVAHHDGVNSEIDSQRSC